MNTSRANIMRPVWFRLPITVFLTGLFYFSTPLFCQDIQSFCSENTSGTVVDFEWDGKEWYATGFFNRICGEAANYIARLENGHWTATEFKITDPGHSLRNIDGELFLARYENQIDSNWVFRLNGDTLQKIGKGVYLTNASGFSQLPHLYDVCQFRGEWIACGEFDKVGNQEIRGIMKWNGSAWEGLGSGLEGSISGTAPVIYPHQLLVADSFLYVVGNFRYAGGKEVNGVARWDGSEWHPLGPGFNNTVYGLCLFQGSLIAGGSFTQSGNVQTPRIARWNHESWEALPFGLIAPSPQDYIYVHTLKEIDGKLFIAGGIKEIVMDNGDLLPGGGIISFDGQVVNTFEGGVDNIDIEAVCDTGDGTIMVGGGVYGKGFLGYIDHSSEISRVPDNEMIFFPNPSDDQICLQTQSAPEDTHYRLMALNGAWLAAGSGHRIDLSTIPPGVYILCLYSKDSYNCQKLIKR